MSLRFGEYVLRGALSTRCRPGVVAALLPLAVAVGCHQPLAVRDAYFEPDKGNVTAVGAAARDVVRYNTALAAARRACLVPRAPADGRDGPEFDAAGGRAALARLCAAQPQRSPQADGGLANAYRRWAEDRVRDLADSATTAAGAGGGQ